MRQVAGVSISSYIGSDGDTRVRINNWHKPDLNCVDLSWEQYQALLVMFDGPDFEASDSEMPRR